MVLDDADVLREVLSDLLKFADLLLEDLPRIGGFLLLLLVVAPVGLIDHDVADNLEGFLTLVPPPETVLFDKGVPRQWLHNQRWRSLDRVVQVTMAPMRQWHLLASFTFPAISRSLSFCLLGLSIRSIFGVPWADPDLICLNGACLSRIVAISCLHRRGLVGIIIIIIIIYKT